jgi:DNA-binding NtrC family response regulator
MKFTARVLLIGDDATVTAAYGTELQLGGYEIRTATSQVEALAAHAADPDLIVLCGLAVMAHPGQGRVPVLRIWEGAAPAAVVRQVHHRIALRAVLQAHAAAAA